VFFCALAAQVAGNEAPSQNPAIAPGCLPVLTPDIMSMPPSYKHLTVQEKEQRALQFDDDSG
jgi:hypothetical protein